MRGNLLYIRDQVAYSHQNHEMTRQTNHSDWKNGNTDSPPGTSKAEQRNISHLQSFKKREEKLIGESQKTYLSTQKYSDGEISAGIEFVSGIFHHESRRLHEKCARQVAQLLHECDLTQCLTITFQSFANWVKVGNKHCFRNEFRIWSLLLKAMKILELWGYAEYLISST